MAICTNSLNLLIFISLLTFPLMFQTPYKTYNQFVKVLLIKVCVCPFHQRFSPSKKICLFSHVHYVIKITFMHCHATDSSPKNWSPRHLYSKFCCHSWLLPLDQLWLSWMAPQTIYGTIGSPPLHYAYKSAFACTFTSKFMYPSMRKLGLRMCTKYTSS